jgi:hypothetical protein
MDYLSQETKVCRRCKKYRLLTEFHKHRTGKNGLNSVCKTCRKIEHALAYDKEAAKKRYNDNKDYFNAYAKKRYHERPDNWRKNHLKRYDLTIEDYEKLLEKQNGKCKICGVHHTELGKKLVVDHAHDSKKVRGLLCYNCNFGLGHFKDSEKSLELAIVYLKDF